MSYLYEISIGLYNKLQSYYNQNKDEFFSLRNKDHLDHEIAYSFYQITRGNDNFYNIFNNCFTNNFYDLDFMADGLEKGIYIGNSFLKRTSGNKEEYLRYFAQKNDKLLRDMTEMYMTKRIINHFIINMRSYYDESFLMNCPSQLYYSTIKNLYHRFNFFGSRIYNKNNYDSLIVEITEHEKVLLDTISEVVDKKEFQEAVLEQQKYYVSELTKLKTMILEKGNITKFSDQVLKIYLDFIDEFIKNANDKIDSLSNNKLLVRKEELCHICIR